MKKEEILKKLRQTQDFVSGQELCEEYGVSRTAVWKTIKQLEKEGYVIEAQNNRGYRLAESQESDILSQLDIESCMDTKWVGRTVSYRKQTASTNLDAKALAEDGAASGSLAVADSQTAGRGRCGHGWVAPDGKDIYMSLMLRPNCRPEKAAALTLVMALAVLEAVREIVSEGAAIKWPNDIVVNKKKVCGILTEMSAELDKIHYVVIGVGINVNRTEFADEIKAHATSILVETGKKTKRSNLIARVMYYFEEYYQRFQETWDVTQLKEHYNLFLVNKDQEVRVLDPKCEYNGIAQGINEKGELIVQREDGGHEFVYAGEVSVRGLYGYV